MQNAGTLGPVRRRSPAMEPETRCRPTGQQHRPSARLRPRCRGGKGSYGPRRGEWRGPEDHPRLPPSTGRRTVPIAVASDGGAHMRGRRHGARVGARRGSGRTPSRGRGRRGAPRRSIGPAAACRGRAGCGTRGRGRTGWWGTRDGHRGGDDAAPWRARARGTARWPADRTASQSAGRRPCWVGSRRSGGVQARGSEAAARRPRRWRQSPPFADARVRTLA